MVSDHAQRVNVGAPVHIAVAHCLLGAHVRGSADRDAGNGEPRLTLRRARDAEVRDQHVSRRALDEDVVGLHVPMHDVARVSVGERVSDFAQHRAHRRERQPRFAREALRERLALDESHREEHHAVDLVHRVDRDDVRVRELRGHLGLAQEARLDLRAERELGGQDLQRHLAVQAHVARTIDHGHAAASDLVLDLEERADRVFNAVAQRVALGHDLPDSLRGEFDLGLMRAISSAT